MGRLPNSVFVRFLLNGLIAGSIYALVTLSYTLIYIPTGFFHFARGAVEAGMRKKAGTVAERAV
jgi:hypothetical protein